METKNVIIIAIAIILCVGIVSATAIYSNYNSNVESNSDSDNGLNLNPNNILNFNEPSLEIINTTFYTGHSLSAKTYCTINVKAENLDEVLVKISYTRDGVNLNNADEYNVTIDDIGNIMLESKESFKKYPDHASVEIYTKDGKLLNSVDVSLATDDSTQVASGNGTVTAKAITTAKHSASSSSSSSTKSDPGAFYSYQDERMIHTGEIVLAPDDHHWKHLGYNEWVKID